MAKLPMVILGPGKIDQTYQPSNGLNFEQVSGSLRAPEEEVDLPRQPPRGVMLGKGFLGAQEGRNKKRSLLWKPLCFRFRKPEGVPILASLYLVISGIEQGIPVRIKFVIESLGVA